MIKRQGFEMMKTDWKNTCIWFLGQLSALFFPSVCVFCENKITSHPRPFEEICRSCLAKIPFRPVLAVRTPCLEHRNPDVQIVGDNNQDIIFVCDYNIDVMIACRYESMIRKALISMKFYEAAYMKHALGSIACHMIRTQDEVFDGIIPIPLHPSRLRERGYNQAELIAAQIAESMKIPLLKDCLIRQKNTKRQSEMGDYEDRLQNVTDAFLCINPEKLAGKNLLLLDDILTSGETMMSAANAISTAVFEFRKSTNEISGAPIKKIKEATKKNPMGDSVRVIKGKAKGLTKSNFEGYTKCDSEGDPKEHFAGDVHITGFALASGRRCPET